MAKHSAPKKRIPLKPVIWSGVSVLALALAVLFVINGGLQAITTGFAGLFPDSSSSEAESSAASAPDEESSSPVSDESSEDQSEDESLNDNSDESSNDNSDESSNDDSSTPQPPEFIRPQNLKGVWLCAGVDYDIKGKGDADEIKKELSSAFGQLDSWGINTVMLPLFADGKALYDSSVATHYTDWDVVAYIASLARLDGICIYGVLDLSVIGDLTVAGATDLAAALATDAAMCGLDGIFLTGYTVSGMGDYAAYVAAGGGDRVAFVRQCATRAMTAATNALRKATPNGYVGLLASPLWATENEQEAGLAVSGLTSDYSLGADTRAWIHSGLFDCVMAYIDTAVGDKKANFKTVFDWWSTLCKDLDLPLYVTHAAKADWDSPDQLAQQLLHCKADAGWAGSAFDSYAALKEDKDGSTAALFKVYSGTLLPEYITDTLVITEPTKTSITTKESQITFNGSADPNFPLKVNGKEIPLTKHGFFSWNTELEPGTNTFAFDHKGRTVEYTVKYTVTVLDSMYPSKPMTLEGGITLTISAIARKDSTVYAVINGQELEMVASPLQQDDDENDALTDFENFSCRYTLPEGIVGTAQELGEVKIFATYADLTETLTGGSVTVEALPEPEPESSEPESSEPESSEPESSEPESSEPESSEPESSDSESSDSESSDSEPSDPESSDPESSDPESSDPESSENDYQAVFTPGDLTSSPTMPEELPAIDPSVGGNAIATGQLIVVTGNFAQTYREDSPDMSRPEYAYLPRGTIDLVVGKIADSSGTYYQLKSGRLVKATRKVDKYEDGKVQIYDVTVVETYKASGTITENTLIGTQVNVGSEYTVMYLGTTWRVPYHLELLPQNYYKVSNTEKVSSPDYTLRSQAAEYLDITFYYTTAVPDVPDVSSSPLFSSAEWIKNDDNYYTLRLHLRKTGAFYGYSAAWDENGNLVLAFQHPQNTTVHESKPLSGFKLVLDPGHGGGYGRPSFGVGVSEHAQCLQIALRLKEKLEALGATVVLTREDNESSPDLYDRADYARNADADMFLSIHTDALDGTVRGISTHYFSQWSYDLAKLLVDYGATTYKAFTGSDTYGTGGKFNRGPKWDPFMVTRLQDCPAVLIECGFLDNVEDRELLIDPDFQDVFCSNLVNAILVYYGGTPQDVEIPIRTTATTTSTTSSETTDSMVSTDSASSETGETSTGTTAGTNGESTSATGSTTTSAVTSDMESTASMEMAFFTAETDAEITTDPSTNTSEETTETTSTE